MAAQGIRSKQGVAIIVLVWMIALALWLEPPKEPIMGENIDATAEPAPRSWKMEPTITVSTMAGSGTTCLSTSTVATGTATYIIGAGGGGGRNGGSFSY